DSINDVINKLEKRLRKIKTKKKDHSLKGFRWVEHQIFEEKLKKSYKKDEEIVEVENFELKPMTIDEAIEQLKLNSNRNDKNNFIVFNDSETNKFSVLYINGKNKYGLIQPE
ncbi:MAG TPA: sigma 54 modulation/S30EA ribosomal C-terminal domain-containing protein, partial [bacterium]|nr:sigma 54 modulation/S30EA ribosomal C-terminal domain-containing protein [bacterium]